MLADKRQDILNLLLEKQDRETNKTVIDKNGKVLRIHDENKENELDNMLIEQLLKEQEASHAGN